MNAWQIEAVLGHEAAEAWANLNAPDPCKDRLIASAKYMDKAVNLMDAAEDFMIQAMDALHDTPMEAKVGSFFYLLQDLRIDIKDLAKQYGTGVRV